MKKVTIMCEKEILGGKKIWWMVDEKGNKCSYLYKAKKGCMIEAEKNGYKIVNVLKYDCYAKARGLEPQKGFMIPDDSMIKSARPVF